MLAQCFLCGTISSPCCYPPLVGNTVQGMSMMVKGSTKTDKGRYGWKPGHAKANKGCLWARKRKIVKKHPNVCDFFRLMEKCQIWPQTSPGGFFPANPNLADILGDADFDFEILCAWGDFLDPKFPDFQVPDFQISRNLAWAGLGPGRAGPSGGPGGPSGGPVASGGPSGGLVHS